MVDLLASLTDFYLNRLTWFDVVDILLVASLILIILHAIRQTRALVVLRGILVFIVLMSFISAFRILPSLSWIINTILPALLISLPILFQDELRRVFFSVGRLGFRRGSGKDFDRLKSTLLTAVERLSYEYIGAVIVIEGLTPLDDIIDTGTLLNAENVTPELLHSIFNPKSPLRHGAVILRGDRLVAANCILPVETESAGPSHLDSSQRSALGMSARAPDALLVILSEESSGLSVVWNERMIDGLSLEKFNDTLDAFKVNLTGRGGSPWKWILGGGLSVRLSSILLAVILSVVIWIISTNISDPIQERAIPDIPLVVSGLDLGLVTTSGFPETVSVMIQSRQSQLERLIEKDLQVELPLSGLSPGEYTVPLQLSLADESIKILSVIPSSLNVVVEQEMSQELQPTIQVMGKENLSPVFAVGELMVVPESVLIHGPQSLVARIVEARIVINVEGRLADFQNDYEPILMDGLGQVVVGLKTIPAKVEVTVPIQRILTGREMAIRPEVNQEKIPQGYEITSIRVSPVAVTILYDSNIVRDTGDFLMTAPVSLANVYNELTVDIPILFPEGVSAVDDQGNYVTSATVTVTVSPVSK